MYKRGAPVTEGHGTTSFMGARGMTLEQRFWPKVDKSGDCWLWTAHTSNVGYGMIGVANTMRTAHRVSYEMAYGEIPEGMDLDHICGVRACVRPEHLRPTTRKQNMENLRGANRNNLSSGVRGVTRDGKKWKAQVCHQGKGYTVGRFDTIAEAEAAAIAKRNELFTHNDDDRVSA
jgi:hypothetical protein